MKREAFELFIGTDGVIRTVHDDALSGLFCEEQTTIRRASHVEPTADGRWTADLSPVGGPVLGPFKMRREALAQEAKWLRDRLASGATFTERS